MTAETLLDFTETLRYFSYFTLGWRQDSGLWVRMYSRVPNRLGFLGSGSQEWLYRDR
jgi:hypothetical protein